MNAQVDKVAVEKESNLFNIIDQYWSYTKQLTN